VTDQEWNQIMVRRLDAWLNRPEGVGKRSVKDLLEWMRMTEAEWYEWRETKIVPKSTRYLLMTVYVQDLLDA
jgi:hypothetical protein